jgi:hypothetical protein
LAVPSATAAGAGETVIGARRRSLFDLFDGLLTGIPNAYSTRLRCADPGESCCAESPPHRFHGNRPVPGDQQHCGRRAVAAEPGVGVEIPGRLFLDFECEYAQPRDRCPPGATVSGLPGLPVAAAPARRPRTR